MLDIEQMKKDLAGIGPDTESLQWEDVESLMRLLESECPRYGRFVNHLEIGRWRGFSACVFASIYDSLGLDSAILSISPNRVAGKDIDLQPAWDFANSRWYNFFLKNGWSHSDGERMIRNHCEELTNSDPLPLDVAFIDGAHEADIAFHDICLAFRHMRPGGLIIVDDINAGFNGTTEDSWRFTLRNLSMPGVTTGPGAAFRIASESPGLEVVPWSQRFGVLRKKLDCAMTTDPVDVWNLMHGGPDIQAALREKNGEPLYPWRK